MAFRRFLDGKLFAKMFKGGAAKLHSKADTVNKLNVFPVPDGDTGDNMSMTMEGGVAAVDKSKTADESLGTVSEQVAHGMLLGARGNSGVILSQLFAGMAKVFNGCEKADVNTVGKALKVGVKQAYSAVVTPTEGTILTVAREAVDYAVSRITPDSTIESFFDDLSEEMNNSLQRTPELLAALREAGVIDSGGAGLVYIMEGFNQILSGAKPEELDDSTLEHAKAVPAAAPVDFSSFTEDSTLEFGYCTELLLRLQRSKTDPDNFDVKTIINYLKKIGDSIVCFKTGSIVKIHVHTFTPDRVLKFCRTYGEFLTVKIENMSVSHNETVPAEIGEGTPEEPIAPRRKYGVVTVASGDGIRDLFKDLGAHYVVNGGQTMNPSAEDFLKAFDAVNADFVFVLPNNSNIILAARQAAGIYDKSEIFVIESRTLGDGYAALSALDYNLDDPASIADSLNEAMDSVVTGMLTTAVRDTNLNGIEIHTGDYIGFIGKEMLASDPDRFEVAKSLLDHMNMNEKFALTVFGGKDTDEESNQALEAYIHEAYPDVEVYMVNGGQDVYDYIFVAE
ncbi:MAG: DAK2 domain-containing protein [Clostridia bacterium]|nr:DAK2 domain-containing protein [Clostridia bacterium]